MKLYFLRHGLAEEKGSWKGGDATRPLTKEGVAKMKRMAAALAALEVRVDAILSSPLTRARQTAEIASTGLGLKITEDKRLAPGFGPGKLRDLLRDHGKADALMFVGHEPDFSKTIGSLIGGGRVVCRKGGLALVELPNGKISGAELVWLLSPRLLR